MLTVKALHVSSATDRLLDGHRKIGQIGSERMLVAMLMMDERQNVANVGEKVP